MPLPVTQWTFEQFIAKLASPSPRRLNEVHIHHTWRPNHSHWRGKSTVEAMHRHHTQVNGWDDIGQHLTIGPDGSLWSGRDFASIPASARGFNGSSTLGPFMIEIVGDFDLGADAFVAPQSNAAYKVVAAICVLAGLTPAQVRFHNEFNPAKSCPGSSLELAAFRKAVDTEIKKLSATLAAWNQKRAAPGVRAMATTSRSAAARTHADAGAEPSYDASALNAAWDSESRSWFGGGPSAAEKALFEKHVVNISMGKLSQSGEACSSPQQLTALTTAIDLWAKDHPAGHVMLYAHGGLVSEHAALHGVVVPTAQKWLNNGVYPVYFVWETGLFETFFGERTGAAERGGMNSVSEFFLGRMASKAWSGMKANAFLSAQETGVGGLPGGAYQLLQALKPVLATNRQLSLHAVGHSAGSIFIGELLANLVALIGKRGPHKCALESIALLAPACTTQLFKEKYMPHIDRKLVNRFCEFTMDRAHELEDHVGSKLVYNDSLLYFVRNACEENRPGILGLQESIKDDAQLQTFLERAPGRVVYSPTTTISGASSTLAIHHGDFDNDPVTMNAVLRRILNVTDTTLLPDAFQISDWGKPAELPHGLELGELRASLSSGSTHALCIGIDNYPTRPLAGCVADAHLWARTLRARGATVHAILLNEAATKLAIVERIRALGRVSKAGDTAVIQFAGHGTQITDTSGDEASGRDQAWVPFDYQSGELLLDDEIGGLIDTAFAPKVNVVLFTDCCHSGSVTRAKAATARAAQSNSRIRALPLMHESGYAAKHARSQQGWRTQIAPRTDVFAKREVHFAACEDHQFAYEANGQGAFTFHANAALDKLGPQADYATLAQQIRLAFPHNSPQTPRFNAAPNRADDLVFGVPAGLTSASDMKPVKERTEDALLAAIEQLSKKVDALEKKIDEL